jgi:hypothetical protein
MTNVDDETDYADYADYIDYVDYANGNAQGCLFPKRPSFFVCDGSMSTYSTVPPFPVIFAVPQLEQARCIHVPIANRGDTIQPHPLPLEVVDQRTDLPGVGQKAFPSLERPHS